MFQYIRLCYGFDATPSTSMSFLGPIGSRHEVTTQMITRREAVRLMGSISIGAWHAATQVGLNFVLSPRAVATKLETAPETRVRSAKMGGEVGLD